MRRLRLLPLAAVLLVAGCDSGSEPGPPVRAEISQIAVLDVPLVDPESGDRWDGSSDGDVYFRLYDADVDFRADIGGDRFNARDDGNAQARNSAEPWYNDVDVQDLPLVWDVNGPYEVRDLLDPLYVGLFDYDASNADDPMGETEVFVLDDFAPSVVTDRPQIITLSGAGLGGQDVRVSITVTFRD